MSLFSFCPSSQEAEAKKLFARGLRSLAVRDYKSAVSFFEDATQIMDSVYGVSADECGDYYLKYGIALFELARLESGVLDGVVSAQAKESATDDDDEGEEEEEVDEDGEGEDEGEGEGEGDAEEGDQAAPEAKKCDPENETVEDVKPGKSAEPSAGTSTVEEDIAIKEPVAGTSSGVSAPVAGTSSGNAHDEDQKEAAEDAEPSNTEIAWEVLSTARDIFRRTLENEGSKVKLADSLQTLAEISLEWENFEAASDLFQESLALKKEVLPEGDRSIAESYYHIGITFSFMNEIERANDCFRSAVQVIETKIANLKKKLDQESSTLSEEERNAITSEINELETLLPDMAARIEDSRDQMINSVQVMQAVEEEESRESEAVAKLSPQKPVNNISHLVKRKRPVSPDPNLTSASSQSTETSDSSAKKLCPSNPTD